MGTIELFLVELGKTVNVHRSTYVSEIMRENLILYFQSWSIIISCVVNLILFVHAHHLQTRMNYREANYRYFLKSSKILIPYVFH